MEKQGKVLLDLQNIHVGYKTNTGEVKAVAGCNLEVFQGDAVGIVGESGSGKSTLAHAILRLLPANAAVSGKSLFNGEDLFTVSESRMEEIRWQELSVVFQKSMNSFSPVHRIGTQIIDIYRVHVPKATKQQVYARMEELFKVVNLPGRVLDLYPHQCSGGMLQRVFISLSLIHQPKLVIFDEATTALDVVIQSQVLNEIQRLEQIYDLTSLMITHDVSVVAETCKKVVIMYAGIVMEFGPVNTVINSPSHPYTRELLSSFPSLTGEVIELKGIPGTIPDLKAEHAGCMFAPRCPDAKDICFNERPAKKIIGDGHFVECHFSGGDRDE